jgi:aspartate racemase
MSDQMIGVVGGVGPYAGLDLVQKVFDNTLAGRDQEHLPLALLSVPAQIADRTAFLVGESSDNPGHALARIAERLGGLGATVVGIPCNTAHAEPIWQVLLEDLQAAGCAVRLVHLIREVGRFVREEYPQQERLGVLCTAGTARSGVYQRELETLGLTAVMPDDAAQRAVHRAIYHPVHGIKAQSHPVSAEAQAELAEGVDAVLKQGAEGVVLACTELPLAIRTGWVNGVPVIDATTVLARALIRESFPEKLTPWSVPATV